jgi:hypothetical protein
VPDGYGGSVNATLAAWIEAVTYAIGKSSSIDFSPQCDYSSYRNENVFRILLAETSP